MKKNIVFLFVGASLPLLAGFLFIKMGGMPVATKGNPLPLEKYLAKSALHAAMRGEVGRKATIPTDESGLRAGAKIYGMHCAVCHGFPNEKPTAIAKGLFPRPPQLLPPKKGVTDDPEGEIFWKVKNGIRLTGMPGFQDSLSDQEMWQVSLFLLNADRLPVGILESVQK